MSADFQKGLGLKRAFTHLAVEILFDDSTGFDKMRWTIFLQEKQK